MPSTSTNPPPFPLRRLRGADAAPYRDLRLESLQASPTAYGSSWEEESAQPLEWFAHRLEHSWTLGGWLGERLCGTAAVIAHEQLKMRHKGIIVGVYVHPDARGLGMGQALIRGLIAHAGGRLDTLLISAEASNTPARRLYQKLGFKEYGREPRAMKIDGRFYDEVLMALQLLAATPAAGRPAPPPAGEPTPNG
ncbi:GNAT family N-acetyltransferase [Bordetella petrii]|uniref:GNAT family N-acetyltransferase n=1 Tax=Bordetella petrii TaxID=94624 RepID=UPI001A956A8C|nr:GNAT family protein [Bordetella petrii]MBO1112598.1 GNAT family N-acetyltransferase [Bordetella petrii]